MVSSKVVLTIPIILAAALCEDLLTCFQPDFVLCEEYLHGVAAEMSLIFFPSLLSLVAVSLVSIFALKLQLRLAREIRPTVTLPLPPPPTVNVIQLEAGTSAGARQTGRNNRDDIKIFDIEDLELEESQPREPQDENYQERKEAKETDFDVRRLNSDPSSFFRVYFLGEPQSPEASVPTCFKPLSVLVERIMMLNIAALILVLISILTNCIRLYFLITPSHKEKCGERSVVVTRLIQFFNVLLIVLYAVVIRKKLCT